ncbi:MAG: hypothetical protein LBQ60_08060 [Bacteroidales bacterium]|nr:hypothetical protein [Bacteroidales bacterium]
MKIYFLTIILFLAGGSMSLAQDVRVKDPDADKSAAELTAQRHSKAMLPYKPAEKFRGDTVSYLEYNYVIRSVQYKGRTAGEILKELEYPVLYIVEVASKRDPGSQRVITRLGLSVRQKGEKPSVLKDYYIVIFFEKPPLLDDYEKVASIPHSDNTEVFTPKVYDFLKDMKVSNISFNEFLVRDPEILELGRQARKAEKERMDRGRRK